MAIVWTLLENVGFTETGVMPAAFPSRETAKPRGAGAGGRRAVHAAYPAMSARATSPRSSLDWARPCSARQRKADRTRLWLVPPDPTPMSENRSAGCEPHPVGAVAGSCPLVHRCEQLSASPSKHGRRKRHGRADRGYPGSVLKTSSRERPASPQAMLTAHFTGCRPWTRCCTPAEVGDLLTAIMATATCGSARTG